MGVRREVPPAAPATLPHPTALAAGVILGRVTGRSRHPVTGRRTGTCCSGWVGTVKGLGGGGAARVAVRLSPAPSRRPRSWSAPVRSSGVERRSNDSSSACRSAAAVGAPSVSGGRRLRPSRSPHRATMGEGEIIMTQNNDQQPHPAPRVMVVRTRTAPDPPAAPGADRPPRHDREPRSAPTPADGPRPSRCATAQRNLSRSTRRRARVPARLLEDHLGDLLLGPARRGHDLSPERRIGQRATRVDQLDPLARGGVAQHEQAALEVPLPRHPISRPDRQGPSTVAEHGGRCAGSPRSTPWRSPLPAVSWPPTEANQPHQLCPLIGHPRSYLSRGRAVKLWSAHRAAEVSSG